MQTARLIMNTIGCSLELLLLFFKPTNYSGSRHKLRPIFYGLTVSGLRYSDRCSIAIVIRIVVRPRLIPIG
jgi:hypothetical protein